MLIDGADCLSISCQFYEELQLTFFFFLQFKRNFAGKKTIDIDREGRMKQNNESEETVSYSVLIKEHHSRKEKNANKWHPEKKSR